MKNIMKNEKGFTLIELLAVIVILGIIAAIAVPSISGIIDNTKKDAHVENADTLISAAEYAIATQRKFMPKPKQGSTMYFTLKWLTENNYIQQFEDPHGNTDGYLTEADLDTPIDTIKPKDVDPSLDGISYVQVKVLTSGAIEYSVMLVTDSHMVAKEVAATTAGEDPTYSPVEKSALDRDYVLEIE